MATEKSPSSKNASVSSLRYVSDEIPGLTRLRKGDAFRYRDSEGRWLTDDDDIDRINKLAIPPAYTSVWICPWPDGHLQATGIDSRGRKQYRYHPQWNAERDENKFERLEAFSLVLPRIRAHVARDLVPMRGEPLSRTVVLATLVRLLDTTLVRVGNDAYLRSNGSYGLTTLRTPHAVARGSVVQLRFRGKSGVMHDVNLDDPRVAKVVRRCQQLPGQELFQYLDEEGQTHTLGSSDVNDYIAEAAGARFTAKDFRTWHGTVKALELTYEARTRQADERFDVKTVVEEVSQLLGNTPAVCRKAYIHPAVLELGTELAADPTSGSAIWRRLAGIQSQRRLSAAEGRLQAFLRLNRRGSRLSRPPVKQRAATAEGKRVKASAKPAVKPSVKTAKATKAAETA
ncbi:DNA topoisomerase [Rhodoferax koreense]|uniref:DNA topoisomerase n=1 Tax=Rhodoferax koreensis TaxID=1842727 RepID=A0A1P8JZB8_9BURK|nr:DNA topoisomerase IB [Rhodoferax koreense]APW39099.1 DNA topoisomerase [Rhodoferax koreense]